jgi:hypothetical protein
VEDFVHELVVHLDLNVHCGFGAYDGLVVRHVEGVFR